MLQIGVKFGRMILAYNSLFVAIIRYVYIVHRQKANQWEFEKVGRLSQIASIVMPVAIEVVGVFTNLYEEYTSLPGFNECGAFNLGLNNTIDMARPKLSSVELTMMYFPESIVRGVYYIYAFITLAVGLNISEGVLYFRIHKSISR